ACGLSVCRLLSRTSRLYHILAVAVLLFFFFFSSRRRHTRSYGDWSSDVCSSDLLYLSPTYGLHMLWTQNYTPFPSPVITTLVARSEERRVGKECRCRWAPY